MFRNNRESKGPHHQGGMSSHQFNNGDKSRSNMTFLRRAFGSQLDLAAGYLISI